MAQIAEIAELVGAAVPSSSSEITRVSGVAGATSSSLVFATDAGSLNEAILSVAGAILTRADILSRTAEATRAAAGSRTLVVRDPRFAFALAARFLAQNGFAQAAPRTEAPSIHPTAVVTPDVQIGRRTSVGPNVVLQGSVIVGDDCTILASVIIYPGTTLGSRLLVQAGAVLGSTGFGYVRNPATGEYIPFPQVGTLHIEDDVEIGANSTIDRGALGETRIGAGTKIDNLVHIAHNCLIGRNCILAAQTGVSGSSVIEDGAILGGQVGLGEHAHVGPGVILGGGAGVLSHKKLFGANQVFWGRPARPLRQYLRDLARLSRS